jgi:hypothetical protein
MIGAAIIEGNREIVRDGVEFEDADHHLSPRASGSTY